MQKRFTHGNEDMNNQETYKIAIGVKIEMTLNERRLGKKYDSMSFGFPQRNLFSSKDEKK